MENMRRRRLLEQGRCALRWGEGGDGAALEPCSGKNGGRDPRPL